MGVDAFVKPITQFSMSRKDVVPISNCRQSTLHSASADALAANDKAMMTVFHGCTTELR